MDRLGKKEKIEISIVAIILILVVYFEFVISPIASINSGIKSDINNLKNKYDEMSTLKSQSISYNKIINKLSEQYNESSKGIPITSKDSEIENSLNLLCSQNGLTLSSINFSQATPFNGMSTTSTTTNTANTGSNTNTQKIKNGTLMQLPVTIIVTGNYNNIISIITALEKDSRVLNFTGFTISNGTSGQEVKATINGNYYYFSGNSKPDYDFNNGSYGKNDLFN